MQTYILLPRYFIFLLHLEHQTETALLFFL